MAPSVLDKVIIAIRAVQTHKGASRQLIVKYLKVRGPASINSEAAPAGPRTRRRRPSVEYPCRRRGAAGGPRWSADAPPPPVRGVSVSPPRCRGGPRWSADAPPPPVRGVSVSPPRCRRDPSAGSTSPPRRRATRPRTIRVVAAAPPRPVAVLRSSTQAEFDIENGPAVKKALKSDQLVQTGQSFRVKGDAPIPVPADEIVGIEDVTEGEGQEAAKGDDVAMACHAVWRNGHARAARAGRRHAGVRRDPMFPGTSALSTTARSSTAARASALRSVTETLSRVGIEESLA